MSNLTLGAETMSLAPDIQVKSSYVYSKPDAEKKQTIIAKTDEKFATESGTGKVIASYKVSTDSKGRKTKKKFGDMSILGIAPDTSFNFMPILLIGGAAVGAYFMFKG